MTISVKGKPYETKDAGSIQNRAVQDVGPSDGQALVWNNANSRWEPASHDTIDGAGSNTHTQIDSHIASTSNPHSVAAADVGNTVAQWNADQLQGQAVQAAAPSDGDVLTWIDANNRWEPQASASGGGNTLDEAYDQGGAGAGADIVTDSGPVTCTLDAIGTGHSDALVGRTTTAATSGAPVQHSPIFALQGEGWDTALTASHAAKMALEVQPVSGDPVTAKLAILASIDGAAYAEAAHVTDAGDLVLGGNLSIDNGGQIDLDADGDSSERIESSSNTLTMRYGSVCIFKRGGSNQLVMGGAGISVASGDLQWADATTVQTTVGAAGAADAPPSAPEKYFTVRDDSGTTLVVAAYPAS